MWHTGSSSSQHELAKRFREGVLLLRRAKGPAAAAPIAGKLRLVLLAAEEIDLPGDGPLLGMAAAQCVRLRLHELLGVVCSFAACRLAGYGGREVAEMATAVAKLGHLDLGFLRAAAEYCASPPSGAFHSMRDIAMAALVFFQSSRGSTTPIDHAMALKGLAEASLLHFSSGQPSDRDVVEFAHGIAHSLDTSPLLQKEPAVATALCAAFKHVRRNMHHANALDVAMIAGAVAAAWPLMEHMQSTVLQPCLVDVANAARFCCAGFSLQDLALIAVAFAKTEVVSEDLAGVFNERITASTAELKNKDLCFFLRAAARVVGWAKQPFARAVIEEVGRRDPGSFSPQDLCTFAQSLVRLGHPGESSLVRIIDSAFHRQLLGFTPRDKATMLWVVSRAEAPHRALGRLLVRTLSAGDYRALERDALCTALGALVQVWPLLSPQDPAPQLLADGICAAHPWHGAAPFELAEVVFSLARLPAPPKAAIWASLLAEVGDVAMDRFSARDLCRLLCGFAGQPAEAPPAGELAGVAAAGSGTRCRRLLGRLASELAGRLQNGEELAESEVQALTECFRESSSPIPPKIAELLTCVSACSKHEGTTDLKVGSKSGKKYARSPKASAKAAAAHVGRKTFADAVDLISVSLRSPPSESCFSSHAPASGTPSPSSSPVLHMKEGLVPPPGLMTEWEYMSLLPEAADFEGWNTRSCTEDLAANSDPLCGSIEESEHGHSHGHGHAHGQGLGCNSSGDPGTVEAQRPRYDSDDERGHGHSHSHSHVEGRERGHIDCSLERRARGQVQECSTGQAQHCNTNNSCKDDTCCPAFRRSGELGDEVRLNTHCDFPGHCVQMKHTFLHIHCNLSDSESEKSDCVVCNLTRKRRSSSF